jgi:hypothetical protein
MAHGVKSASFYLRMSWQASEREPEEYLLPDNWLANAPALAALGKPNAPAARANRPITRAGGGAFTFETQGYVCGWLDIHDMPGDIILDSIYTTFIL